jgi:hypothetical protein
MVVTTAIGVAPADVWQLLEVCCVVLNILCFSSACLSVCGPTRLPLSVSLPACLQAINRGAEVIECQNAQVDLGKILGITAFSLDKLLEADPDFLVSEGVRCE